MYFTILFVISMAAYVEVIIRFDSGVQFCQKSNNQGAVRNIHIANKERPGYENFVAERSWQGWFRREGRLALRLAAAVIRGSCQEV